MPKKVIKEETIEETKSQNNEPQVEEAPVSEKKIKVKKILNISFTVVEVAVVVFLLIVSLLSMASTTMNATSVASNPITNTSLFPVLTDSMSPTFKAGDLVYGKQFTTFEQDYYKRLDELDHLKSDEDNGINKGDIIIYWTKIGGDEVIVTHRVRKIKIEKTVSYNGKEYNIKSFFTRGDAEEPTDENTLAIDSRDIIGYYEGNVKYIGAIINGLQNNKTLMFFVLVFPLILLFLWNGYSFIRIIFVNKKETAIEEINLAHETEKAQLLEEAKRLALEELRKEQEEQNKKK